jgi:hypothetical protein
MFYWLEFSINCHQETRFIGCLVSSRKSSECSKFQIILHASHAIPEIQMYQNKTPSSASCPIMKVSMISNFPCLPSAITSTNGGSYSYNVLKIYYPMFIIKYFDINNISTNRMHTSVLKVVTQRPPTCFDHNMAIFMEVKYKG